MSDYEELIKNLRSVKDTWQTQEEEWMLQAADAIEKLMRRQTMNDNDSIKRSTVLGTLIANYLVGNLTKEALQLYTQEINDIPAVPHEMTAREFLKEFERMCKVNGGSTIFKCSTECPIFDKVKGYLLKCEPWVKHHPEEAVAIVEKWAREHPERSEK